ncbi:APC family permease [Furfurilactobacillus rossiae]|uniref:Amino acid permease n=1 Tax=Furfurilactobacillus rossiae DSM 15814 TaxID=1114972 RepID=A0A0R1RGR5_9LACO|nr:APC family permease [Furfurilactobacillus rossiae]KRL53946.1 hypothetical protein FD35_GL000777 [Furfurilactobacillus rossiae DSM 15814]MCF6164547.1 APC family permease [Furfurilactobacillus rossiae]QFR66637.1 amino acid permease [Furfurilactobacillus rossiae]QLE62111.1 amino acid permease [Furfurilactobacillus rossiae]QLE64830.1 amino acid permease [Furfurilactobacillus rossiae]
MKGRFGFLSIVLFGINAIVGSGIFLLPNTAMKLIGPASLLVFVFDMFLVVSIALCFAEDASLFKQNGGPYVYAKAAFGDFVGYEVGFIIWVISIIAWATMAAGLATALGAFWPVLAKPVWHATIITVLLVGLGVINILGVSVTKWLNNVVTVAKIIPLVLFVAIGLFFLHAGNFTPFFPHGHYVAGSFGQAAIVMFYAFTGFEAIVIAAEDMKNPQHDVPRAIITVMGIVALLYFLIQTVSIGVLGTKLATTTAPMQEALTQIIGPVGKYIIGAGTIISITGISVAQSFTVPRSGQAMADNGVMPKIVGRVNHRGVPYVAVIISVALALPLALTGTFSTLAAISVVSRFAQYVPTIIAVLVFRRTRPDQPRSFKVPFGPVIPVIAILVSCWLLAQAKPINLFWGLGALLVAVPFYFLTKKNRQEIEAQQKNENQKL